MMLESQTCTFPAVGRNLESGPAKRTEAWNLQGRRSCGRGGQGTLLRTRGFTTYRTAGAGSSPRRYAK
jgi:hypothetical protein